MTDRYDGIRQINRLGNVLFDTEAGGYRLLICERGRIFYDGRFVSIGGPVGLRLPYTQPAHHLFTTVDPAVTDMLEHGLGEDMKRPDVHLASISLHVSELLMAETISDHHNGSLALLHLLMVTTMVGPDWIAGYTGDGRLTIKPDAWGYSVAFSFGPANTLPSQSLIDVKLDGLRDLRFTTGKIPQMA